MKKLLVIISICFIVIALNWGGISKYAAGVLTINEGTGKATFTGDVAWAFVHGSWYDASYTPSLTQNVPLKFTPGGTAAEQDGLTIAGDTIVTNGVVGSYNVFFTCNMSSNNNNDFEIRLKVDNVEYNTALRLTGSTTSTSNYTPMAYNWYLEDIGSNISFYIVNLTNNDDPVVRNTHVVIQKIPE